MRPALTLATLLLALGHALPVRAADGPGCRIDLGPDDRLAQGEDLVVPGGVEVGVAMAVRGNVVLQAGARVRKAVAVGGSVVLGEGAQVREDAVALGGDVLLRPQARVGKDAVALGGKVLSGSARQVGGSVLGVSFQFGKGLGRRLLEELGAEGCEVVARANAD